MYMLSRIYISFCATFLLLLSNMATAQKEQPVDTAWHFTMQPITITAERDWENDTLQYRYNQMKYYVTTILPYLDEAVVLFNDLNHAVNDESLSRRERKDYINEKEDELKLRFEDEIVKLNETQGVLLVKLIARQTGVNVYQMLKEFKNPFTALKWLGWAKLNGFNLNRKYHPEEEDNLEHIMEGLGYPLPPYYEKEEIVKAN